MATKTPPPTELTNLVGELLSHDIDFVLVGGLAAVVQGAPVVTFDVDVVHGRSPENIDRLMALLSELDAHYRGQGDRRLPPDPAALAGEVHQLLQTRLGPLDLLGAIGDGQDFGALLPHTLELPFRGKTARVLSLARIIELKGASTHPKDRQALPILEETLERKK